MEQTIIEATTMEIQLKEVFEQHCTRQVLFVLGASFRKQKLYGRLQVWAVQSSQIFSPIRNMSLWWLVLKHFVRITVTLSSLQAAAVPWMWQSASSFSRRWI